MYVREVLRKPRLYIKHVPIPNYGFMLNRLIVLAKKLPLPLLPCPSFFPFELDDDDITTSDFGRGGSFKLTRVEPPPPLLLILLPRPPPPPLIGPNSWLPWSVIMMLGLVGVLGPELPFAILVALFCREYTLLTLLVGDDFGF